MDVCKHNFANDENDRYQAELAMGRTGPYALSPEGIPMVYLPTPPRNFSTAHPKRRVSKAAPVYPSAYDSDSDSDDETTVKRRKSR